jgi:1,2-diacylglycerol 3-alpha-glucosyltransferase
MRIAIFTDTYLPDVNGVAHSIDRFSKLLADDGHQVVIFTTKNRRHRDKKYPNLEIRRYTSVTFPTYKDIRIALPFVLRVVADLREFNPDVVHIQTPMGIGWMAIWATKILKLKNVQTYHTYIPDFLLYLKPKSLFGFKKMVNFVASSRLMRLLLEEDVETGETNGKLKQYLQERLDDAVEKANSEKTGERTEKFAWEYTKAIYNRGNLVLTPSKVLRDALVKHGVKSPVNVLSNGIEYGDFDKKTDYSVGYKIIHVGRLGYEKHLEIPIRALKIAIEKNPKITLDVIGDGPARKSWEQLSKQLGINKNVKFLGFVKREELFKKYSQYDAFITGSTIETQGIVLLEAMAAGLPVIAVKELAVPEIVIDGKNGYLSKPFKEKEMANNILKLFEDENRIKKFGQYSLKIAESHEIHKCKDKLLEYYKSLT